MHDEIVVSTNAPKGWFVLLTDKAGNRHRLGLMSWVLLRKPNGDLTMKTVTWGYKFEWYPEDKDGFIGYEFKKPAKVA